MAEEIRKAGPAASGPAEHIAQAITRGNATAPAIDLGAPRAVKTPAPVVGFDATLESWIDYGGRRLFGPHWDGLKGSIANFAHAVETPGQGEQKAQLVAGAVREIATALGVWPKAAWEAFLASMVLKGAIAALIAHWNLSGWPQPPVEAAS